MIKIPLTQGLDAIIDDADFPLVAGRKWYANGYGIYIYACSKVKGKNTKMHRLIMGEPEGKSIDHINGDCLDNRRLNLRSCTTAENCQNRTRPQSNNTSGVRGVSWWEPRNKWRVHIQASGKKKMIGEFNSFNDATEARLLAEKKYYGEFAPMGG